jgi:hypothetical protein
MEGRQLSRASSLPDLATPTAASPHQTWTGSALVSINTLHLPGGSTASLGSAGLSTASNLCSQAPYGSSEEDGLALLIHGSPISDGTADVEESEAGGLQLLDYESETESGNETMSKHDFRLQRQIHAEMDTDPPREPRDLAHWGRRQRL